VVEDSLESQAAVMVFGLLAGRLLHFRMGLELCLSSELTKYSVPSF
jgi:hypothetical protein